jgi:hypothetical protein
MIIILVTIIMFLKIHLKKRLLFIKEFKILVYMAKTDQI